MHRFTPPAVFVIVTALFVGYGRFSYSWIAGPVAALALYALDRKAAEPAEPAPGRARASREPAPVD